MFTCVGTIVGTLTTIMAADPFTSPNCQGMTTNRKLQLLYSLILLRENTF